MDDDTLPLPENHEVNEIINSLHVLPRPVEVPVIKVSKAKPIGVKRYKPKTTVPVKAPLFIEDT